MVVTNVKGFAQFGKLIDKQCTQFSGEMQRVEVTGAREVGVAVVGAVSAHLGGNPIKMSGVSKKGARVGVVAKTIGREVVVKMTGPAHLIERDTSPHTLLGRGVGRLGKGKGSRSAEAKHKAKQQLYDALFGGAGGGPMLVNGEWRTGPFQHPGTKGKHPFEKGVDQVKPLTPEIYARGVRRGMKKAFTG